MQSIIVSLLLSFPAIPSPEYPLPDEWTGSMYLSFGVAPYTDDAGVAQAALEVEYRLDSGSYGANNVVLGAVTEWSPSIVFTPDGARWCWHARFRNANNQTSAFSPERCFRVDGTPPPVPTLVAPGTISGGGKMAIAVNPVVDATSGLAGYDFVIQSADGGVPNLWAQRRPGPVVPRALGQGNWRLWPVAIDVSGNVSSDANPGSAATLLVNVAVNPAIPTPPAPVWASPRTTQYGSALLPDNAWKADAGVDQFVASFRPVGNSAWRMSWDEVDIDRWVQLEDEGIYEGRVAGVNGTSVGPWSAPTVVKAIVDRTAPTAPSTPTASPDASVSAPVLVQWVPGTDTLSSVETQLEEQALPGGTVRTFTSSSNSLTVTPAEGRFQYRARAVDATGNRSPWTAYSNVVLRDATGPVSTPPVAQPRDGGVLVTWSIPIDALGTTAGMTLSRETDAGATLATVTGTSRFEALDAGTYAWRLRGVDPLGNVGAWSALSNTVVVEATGAVGVGPAIAAVPPQAATCAAAFSLQLAATGDAPIAFALISGPPGLTVSEAGLVTWPLPQQGTATATVAATNPVASMQTSFVIDVACAADAGVDGGAPDAGAADAGTSDAGVPAEPRHVAVGCGCGVTAGPWLGWALLALACRRRRPAN